MGACAYRPGGSAGAEGEELIREGEERTSRGGGSYERSKVREVSARRVAPRDGAASPSAETVGTARSSTEEAETRRSLEPGKGEGRSELVVGKEGGRWWEGQAE